MPRQIRKANYKADNKKPRTCEAFYLWTLVHLFKIENSPQANSLKAVAYKTRFAKR